jgi:hypothetical protein
MKTSSIAGLHGSLILAYGLLGYDALLTGSFLMTFLAGPYWLLFAIARALVQRNNLLLSAKRIVLALVTMGIVFGNSWLQSRIAHRNAELIIHACTQYQKSHGSFPPTLETLVPEYLSSVPRAKYSLIFGGYLYSEWEGKHDLMWIQTPPFGRPYYMFEEARWGYLD